MRDLDETALAWIKLHDLGVNVISEETEALFWSFETVSNWVGAAPEMALQFILKVISLHPSDRVLENLAAGPLEDLLVGHGREMMSKIVEAVDQVPGFVDVLAGVWPRRLDADVRSRLSALRTK